MRETLHLCLASHDEVLFRSEDDYNHAFNCFAVACVFTESRVLGESFMSDHMHGCVQTDCFKELMKRYRYAYTRYFNAKYHRIGRLGERLCFFTEMEGMRHILAGLSYVFRQGLHHGLCSTPFAYPHSSVNSIFREALGKNNTFSFLPDDLRYLYLPDDCKIPNGYRMTESGLLLRDDIIDTRYVEELYITPKSFLFYMNRPSDEKWRQEQLADASHVSPITLKSIERNVVCSVEKLLGNEFGKPNRSHFTDQELCGYIDNEIVPSYDATSIYEIPLAVRRTIAENLLREFDFKSSARGAKYADQKQIARCMALSHPNL